MLAKVLSGRTSSLRNHLGTLFWLLSSKPGHIIIPDDIK